MRTIDSSISVLKPSNIAWWHTSWTGRFILAALLIAAAAFVLTPGRTSAQNAADPTAVCKSEAETGGVISSDIVNDGLIADCVALLTASDSLTEDAGNGINWIIAQGETLPRLSQGSSSWDGVTVDEVDDGDPDTDDVMRVTAVELPTQGLTGKLADEWADLDALTILDLSDNGLTGTVPRSVWAFFDDKIAEDGLNLGDNPMLEPSPALNLKAVVTKEAAGTTQVALTWDDIGWYTSNEIGSDMDTGERTTHKFKYRRLPEVNSDGVETWGEYMDIAVGTTKGDRSSAPASGLVVADTYSFQVVTVKTTFPANDDATPDVDESATAISTVESEVSQIDVVGPQTLTAGSNYPLKVNAEYSLAGSLNEDGNFETKELAVLKIEKGALEIVFKPTAATEDDQDVIVELNQSTSDVIDDEDKIIGQAGGSHTFSVKVLSADSAPTVTVSRIPHREVVNQRRATRIDLSRYFPDDDLMYTVTSSKETVATVDEIDGWLRITTVREGRTQITVIAENPDHGKVSREFWVTVVSPNNAPQLIGNIPDLTLYLDDAGTQVDMAQYFRDQDNEFLRLIPQSSNPMVVTATSVGRNVIFSVNGLGEIRMTIIAQDGAGATAFGTFTVTVLDPNDAPKAVGTIPPQTIRLEDPGLALSLGSYFTDADNDRLTYRAVSADKGVVTVEVTEAIVTLTAVAEGGDTVTVTAADPGGKSATQEILVTVLPANRPPEAVGQIPDQTLQYDDEPLGLDVTMYFTDPDGDELNYVGEGTDESVAEVRVRSHGVVRVDPLSHGEIEVTVTARDPLGASVSQSFMVTVQGNLPPEAVGVIDDQVLLEGGNAVTINVTEYFSDPNGDELTYMGTSANPDAVQAVVIGGSSELVLRPFAPAEEVTITVTAMDPEGESAAQLVTVSVVAAAPPPTATPMPTATPEPTAVPEPTATPAPTATFVPTGGDGGFPVGLIIVLVLVLAGVAAAVFIIQRRR